MSMILKCFINFKGWDLGDGVMGRRGHIGLPGVQVFPPPAPLAWGSLLIPCGSIVSPPEVGNRSAYFEDWANTV